MVTALRQSRRARWIVPLMIVAVLSAVAVGRASLAGAAPALPRLTAAQLLAKVAQAHVEQMSGVVRTSTDLGLPSLPDAGGGGLTPQALLSGTHTLRVYLDGPDRQRVDLLGKLAETNVVHNGRDLWTWSSSTNKATHTRLPAKPAGRLPGGLPGGMPGGMPGRYPDRPGAPDRAGATPQALAQRLLETVGPTTSVSVGNAATVAGRSAYDLRLAPKSTDSLVNQADLFVDSRTGLPLRVTVLARGDTRPAIDIGFRSISFKAPAAKVFAFTAPHGAKVQEQAVPHGAGSAGQRGNPGDAGDPGDPGLDRDLMKPRDPRLPPAAPLAAANGPRVLGTGWAQVVEFRGLPAGALGDNRLRGVLQGARSVTGTFGSGRLLTTTLLTALITDDGRVFLGAVTPSALVRTANTAR